MYKQAKEQNREKKRMGIALRRFILGTAPSYKHMLAFGCDRDFMRAFIEHQFRDGMSWENFTDNWQVGHIVPLALFNQTDSEELRICWNWINIRPVSLSQYRPRLPYDVLTDRKNAFPTNQAVDLLMDRTKRDRVDPVDWESFQAKNKFHVVWEGSSNGHRYIRTGKDYDGGCGGVAKRCVLQ